MPSVIRFLQLFFLLLVWASAHAADDSTMPAAASSVPEGVSNPQATMATFLHAMNDIKRGNPDRIDDAITTLDLDHISPLVRPEQGGRLAWLLLEVIDRTRRVDLQRIPSVNSGPPWVFATYPQGTVRIARRDDGRWQFDRATIESLPALFDTVADDGIVDRVSANDEHLPWDIRIRRLMPAALKETTFLLENWRWVALLVIVGLGVIADKLTTLLLRGMMKHWLRRRSDQYQAIEDSENRLRPLGLLVMAAIWWLGVVALGLPDYALLVLLVAVKALASAAAVWTAYRLVDLFTAWLTVRAEASDNKIDDVLVPLIPRTLKIFITVIGIVFVAENLDIDVSGLLAGLGLGGLAFALAAKDMVQNLFGSITVIADRTFVVGDWIVVDGQEGTVEQMGFRSTRLRTFYNSVLTIPNSVFITAKVDNMGSRRYRRYKAKFALAYDTPPHLIDAFCEGVREIVRQHPYMRKDYYHVYLNDLGGSALEVLVYVFWETPDWSTELRERHRFLLDSLRLARALGVEYAFPTQTLYLRNQEHEPSTTEEQPADQAMAFGQAKAREVVGSNLTPGRKPGPVSF